jgi:hypothetical protein
MRSCEHGHPIGSEIRLSPSRRGARSLFLSATQGLFFKAGTWEGRPLSTVGGINQWSASQSRLVLSCLVVESSTQHPACAFHLLFQPAELFSNVAVYLGLDISPLNYLHFGASIRCHIVALTSLLRCATSVCDQPGFACAVPDTIDRCCARPEYPDGLLAKPPRYRSSALSLTLTAAILSNSFRASLPVSCIRPSCLHHCDRCRVAMRGVSL